MNNVIKSQQDNLWITQTKNGPLLAHAFREGRVVLFFSVNRSKAFQGYAHMTSLPDSTIRPPPWITTTRADMHTTPPFHVHWVTTAETPFHELSHLKNDLNEHLPVSVGRDGQEFPEECARRMMRIMDRPAAGTTGLGRSRWSRRGGSAGVEGENLLVDFEAPT
ncbi:hypothetical protein E4U42_001721 [Claviceps africana]|uniref:YTH domain-containing protein n=1 Tax=Claviceps africana TaxID=83212 RepID=A0A8K0J8W7_9HYPO|nr:hypothetical protein E4U42_001721 [Claviceps africana]